MEEDKGIGGGVFKLVKQGREGGHSPNATRKCLWQASKRVILEYVDN